MAVVHGFLLITLLIIISRLLELQIVRGEEYHSLARSQHFGGVVLPAKRGEVLARNSRTGETSILATNTTLDLVYIDPLITDDPTLIAEILSDILVTEEFFAACTQGKPECPRELIAFFAPAFDPLERVPDIASGALLEPIPDELPPALDLDLPDLTETRRLFARNIERRIADKRVTFTPLTYGATKLQMRAVEDLSIPGITVLKAQNLIYANPEDIPQTRISTYARKLSAPVQIDPEVLKRLLRSRPLRYVPVMRRLTPSLSSQIRESKLESLKETRLAKRQARTLQEAQEILDPLRSIALIAEHWRFYPDETIGSHVVGFLNTKGEAQYGVERTFDPQLKGQEGLISTVSDPLGGQIITGEQTIIDPKDGDTIVLTIDRFVQKEVETILNEAVETYDADSAQAIVMDPQTGRIIAMANAPLFDSNAYGQVFDKEVIFLDNRKQAEVVIEIYHPENNAFVLKSYVGDIFTDEGRDSLSVEKKTALAEVEVLYDLTDIIRYYLYIGENSRIEIFPTDRKEIWLTYRNRIGVGAYLNRTIQEIYEPGSVTKAITMAIALDQGEVTPADTYDDFDPVEVDEYTIKNALEVHYGTVTMTNCLEYSVNTCMTSVSTKLGRKLFHRMLERFGFGQITGIELEDELPGEMLPWRKWSNALLATAAYGQGISSTPLQVVTGFSALANGGRLLRPTIIDSVIHSDGTVDRTEPKVIDRVITPESSATITAMLVSAVDNGFAKTARVPGYRVAGKTGTSQIAGPGGKYETGTGAHITSFAGYAPADSPKFTILVKLDRPRIKGMEYGSKSAAPIFKDIAAFLFEYYGIPPER